MPDEPEDLFLQHLQRPNLSRRDFVQAAAGSGLAAALLPAAASKYIAPTLRFDTFAALTEAVAAERRNVAAGRPVWAVGQPMTCNVETRSATRLWNGYNARTVSIGNKRFVLGSDAARILASVARPADGVGADDDSAYGSATRRVYTRLLGAWDAGAPLANKTLGPLRVRAMDNGWSLSGGYAGDTHKKGTYVKGEAEAPFVGVRVCLRLYGEWGGASPPLDGYRWAVATSEDGRNDSVARAWTRIVGGVSTANGWVTGDFTGGDVTTDTTPQVPPGAYQPRALHVMRSAWIPLPSLPRTDVVGGRPIWLLRGFNVGNHPMTIFGPSSSGTPGALPPLTGDVIPGAAWSRMRRMTNLANVNGVDSIGQVPGSTFSLRDYCHDLFLEFVHDRPVRSLVNAGDSTSENFGDFGWWAKAVRELSTDAAPCVPLNLGRSGETSATYVAILRDLLDNGAVCPTDVFLQCYSPNDGGGTASCDARHALLLSVIRPLVALGTRVVIGDGTPNNSADRSYSQSWARALAQTGLVTYCAMGASMEAGGGDHGFGPGMGYDALHPSYPTGVDAAYPVVKAHLASIATL